MLLGLKKGNYLYVFYIPMWCKFLNNHNKKQVVFPIELWGDANKWWQIF